MGYPFIGAEHVVLALLAGRPDDVAGRAMWACGLDHDCVASKVLESWTGGLPPCPPQSDVTSAGPDPHTRQVLGRAEGLAGETGGVRSITGCLRTSGARRGCQPSS